MTPDILIKYGIHLISTVQACFPGPYGTSQLLCQDDTRLLFLENEKVTKIIAGAGESFPAGMSRVDYCVDGQATVVETADRVGLFAGQQQTCWGCWPEEHRAFMRALRDEEAVLVDGDAARQTMRVARAAEQAVAGEIVVEI